MCYDGACNALVLYGHVSLMAGSTSHASVTGKWWRRGGGGASQAAHGARAGVTVMITRVRTYSCLWPGLDLC